MATDIFFPTQPMQIFGFQISGNGTQTFKFAGNMCAVLIKRGDDTLLSVIDYWTANPQTIYTHGSSNPTLTHTANSREVTVANNKSISIVVFVMSEIQ